MSESPTDQELADRLRASWKQVRDDAIALGRRGYKTHVSMLDYKTWCRFELSHFQTMGEDVRINKSQTETVTL